MEQLIDLLRKYIVLNKTICKDIQGAISEVSSDDFSEEDLLDYYETIPSEDKSLIYACLAKILNYKEYLLSKDIEQIAKSWDDIKLGSESFRVPYVINLSSFKKDIEKYKTINSSDKLIECLKSINGVEEVKKGNQYDIIAELLEKIAKKIEKPSLEPYMSMARIGTGKTYFEIPSKIATMIYEEWNKIYNKENKLTDKDFLNLFSEFDGKYGKISTFFRAFKIGIDCSGYVNQVYGQWMLKHGKNIKDMIDTIGPNKDTENYKYKKGHKCRDNCMIIREKKYLKVDYSLWHVGYFFPVKEIINKPESINIWTRTDNIEKVKNEDGKKVFKSIVYEKTKKKIDMKTVNETVKSNLKAGDLICFQHENPQKKSVAHYVIVEKTGINEEGQWYFCITESTEADMVDRKYNTTESKEADTDKFTIDRQEMNGVRHNEGHYTSIEEFVKLRKSSYEFFWFCRPKAIAEYYKDSITEYKEEKKVDDI